MPQTLYYVKLDNDVFGPFSLEKACDMHLLPDVEVLSTEANEWKEACDYAELIDSLDLSLLEQNQQEPGTTYEQEFTRPLEPPTFDERSVFYIRRGDNPYGPYNLEALASVNMTEDTAVSVDGMHNWFRAYEIDGLLSTLASIRNLGQQEDQTGINLESATPATIESLMDTLSACVPNDSAKFRRVFDSADDERVCLINEYSQAMDAFIDKLSVYHDL